MKAFHLLTLALISMVCSLRADVGVLDTTSDYISRHRSDLRKDTDKPEHVIKIEIDTRGNGRKDVLLSTEKSSHYGTNQYENNVYVWDLYLNLGNGRYLLFDRKKAEVDPGVVGFLNGQTIDLDPSKIYVGQISELGVYGILAIYYLPKHNEVMLSAFVFHPDYFEELSFPDFTKTSGIYHRDDRNEIQDLPAAYKHYLSTTPITITTLPDTF